MNLQLRYPLDNESGAAHQSLERAIERALDKSGYVQLRELDIRVDDGHVHLQGRLPSYYLKQLAGHIISEVPGVLSIVDRIDVVN